MYHQGHIELGEYFSKMVQSREQAKEMERKQMEHAWRGGIWSVELGGEFEQYYNETYKPVSLK